MLLKSALDGRNGARWAVALALGLRQGEALGLKWADVDLDAGSMFVRRGRLRPRWQHGCGDTCGRKYAGHTAATVLLLLGVPERAVMSIMGWSNTAMTARYQHVTSAIQRDIANRVGGLIWQVSGNPSGEGGMSGGVNTDATADESNDEDCPDDPGGRM